MQTTFSGRIIALAASLEDEGWESEGWEGEEWEGVALAQTKWLTLSGNPHTAILHTRAQLQRVMWQEHPLLGTISQSFSH